MFHIIESKSLRSGRVVSVSNDGKVYKILGEDGRVREIDASTGEIVNKWAIDRQLSGASVCDELDALAFVDFSGQLFYTSAQWARVNDAMVKKAGAPARPVQAAVLGHSVLELLESGEIWSRSVDCNVASCRSRVALPLPPDPDAVVFSDEGKRVVYLPRGASANDENALHILNLETGSYSRRNAPSLETDAAISPDHSHLVLVSRKGEVTIIALDRVADPVQLKSSEVLLNDSGGSVDVRQMTFLTPNRLSVLLEVANTEFGVRDVTTHRLEVDIANGKLVAEEIVKGNVCGVTASGEHDISLHLICRRPAGKSSLGQVKERRTLSLGDIQRIDFERRVSGTTISAVVSDKKVLLIDRRVGAIVADLDFNMRVIAFSMKENGEGLAVLEDGSIESFSAIFRVQSVLRHVPDAASDCILSERDQYGLPTAIPAWCKQ